MKTKNIILVTILFSALFVNCNEAKVDKSAIEGKIVALLPPCQGNGILISVENIQNFGESGSFIYYSDSLIYYQNSIVVPYFDKSIEGGNKIPSLLSDGDELIFECRIKTDADDSLFYSNIVCNMDLIPPSAPRYIITKIISYQKK